MKVFHTALIPFFICFNIVATAQSPNWEWAKSSIAQGNANNGTGITTDRNGYVYVTGSFVDSSITFGSITLANYGTTHNENFFIVKYDTAGNTIWAKSGGGTDNDYTQGISADGEGNIYITGEAKSTTLFLGDTTLTNTGDYNVFIIKYSSRGNVIWAKSSGGSASDIGESIGTDANGNAYLTGISSNSTISFGDDTLTNTGGQSSFVVKYDSSGNLLWAESLGTTGGYCDAFGISVDGWGNAYITGTSDAAIIFGNDTLSNGGFFIVKYNASGNVIWAKNTSAGESNYGNSIITDANGNIYVTGDFYDPSINFGSTTLFNTAVSADFFLVKYDSTGAVLWAKTQVEGPGDSKGISISADARGYIYLAGTFWGTITVGNFSLTNSDATGITADFFIIKYDSLGNVVWIKSAGGIYGDAATGICLDINDNAYVTGAFNSPDISFGNHTLNNNNDYNLVTHSPFPDIFTAKLGNNTSAGIATVQSPITAISVYPNPSTGKVNFKSVQGGHTLQIYNLLGEVISTSTIDEDNCAVNLTSISKGIYFYRITNESSLFQSGSIVIE